MTTLTVSLDRQARGNAPGVIRRSLRATATAVKATVAQAVSPHRMSLQRLAQMPLTVAGAAGIDFSAFHVTHALGWLVTGVSLVVIEYLASDDDGSPA